MIISMLQGGLGNQLFQYGLGKHLAMKHGVPYKLDINWYQSIPDRQYDLHHFSTTAQIANPAEIQALKGPIPDLLARKLKLRQRNVVHEPSLSFHPEILKTGPNAYLVGYWQSEKYFQEIADQLKKEFTVKAPPTGLNKKLLEQIKGSNAISVHVRRGDYVANQAANQFHGTCSPEYYQKAAQQLAKKVSKPHIFVFSDDPTWTQENIRFDHPTTYISHNGNAAHEDLRLMNHCQHFVVANSTFSWWGAWLSSSPNKIVIAPKQWFRNRDSADLVPESWTRI